MDLVVRQADRVADDVVCLGLQAHDGSELPEWAAGSHIDVILPSGLVRQYSLCGDPDDRATYQIAVLREPQGRGGSAEIHDTIRVGTSVAVRGPRNHFALEPVDRYEFIAGGIGITPILAMAREAGRAGRSWHLTYGGCCRSAMAFVDEVTALAAAPGAAGAVTIVEQDVHGHPDLAAIMSRAANGAAVYCCGPPALIDATVDVAARVAPSIMVRSERFTPAASVGAADATTFEVELAGSGQLLRVPADRSVLCVLRDAGFEIESSCEEGTCGTCETRVLAGVPDHRDVVLTDEERAANDVIMVCVSRSVTPLLVLDL